jgi:invasin D
MQSFAQRYTQANSTFDNLNKVLSGAISSMADSAKDVLKALGDLTGEQPCQ